MGQRNDITNNIIIGNLTDDLEAMREYIAKLKTVIRNAGSLNEIRSAEDVLSCDVSIKINENYKKRVNALSVVD